MATKLAIGSQRVNTCRSIRHLQSLKKTAESNFNSEVLITLISSVIVLRQESLASVKEFWPL